MKWITLLLLLNFLSLPLIGQKKKEINANQIKSVVVNEQKTEKGKSITQKESETYYDTHGNVIEEKEYKDGKITKHITYQYDNDNNKIKETEIGNTGKKIKVSEYKYHGNLKTEKTVFDGNGKVKSKKTYIYEKY